MTETSLLRHLLLAAPKHGARLFRNNVGIGWAGQAEVIRAEKTVLVGPGDVVVRRARPLHAGLCEGSSDLVGWARNGLFVAVEGKAPTGRLRASQTSFLASVNASGAIGGIARSVEDLENLLERD